MIEVSGRGKHIVEALRADAADLLVKKAYAVKREAQGLRRNVSCVMALCVIVRPRLLACGSTGSN